MIYNDLQKRTFEFAVAVAKLIEQLPNNVVNQIYFSQIIRSSSSVGANYRASQRAKSINDFLYKLKIVEEETDESIYFLELLAALNLSYLNLIQPLIDEGTQILKIIAASIRTTRARMQSEKSKKKSE